MNKEFSATFDHKRDDAFFESLESSARNNLGQIFGTQGFEDASETLKYQAQKYSVPMTPKGRLTWTAELAKVVTAHKHGKNMGKVGVALLKSNEGICKIIIYRTKTKVLTTFTLNLEEQSCQLHSQNGFLQFYDDNNVYWCIYFEPDDEVQFVKKLRENGIKIRQGADDAIVKVPIVSPKIVQRKSPFINKSEKMTEDTPQEKNVDLSPQTPLSVRMSKIGEKLPALPAAHIQSSPSKHKQVKPPPSESSDDDKNETPSRMTSKAQLVSTTSLGWLGNVESTTTNPLETQFMQMLLSENRTQNTEMRMNMGKLEHKIEKILDKIQLINAAPTSDKPKKKAEEDETILELEEKLVEVRKENRKLKQDLETKLQEMEDKITQHLLFEYKHDFERLGITGADDLDELTTNLLKITTTTVGNMDKCVKLKNDYMRQVDEQQKKQTEDNKKIINLQIDVEALKATISSLQDSLSWKEKVCTELQEELKTVKQLDVASVAQLNKQTEATIKTLMNNLYADLSTKIEGLNAPNSNEIIGIIGRTIRDETLEAMKYLQQDAKTFEST